MLMLTAHLELNHLDHVWITLDQIRIWDRRAGSGDSNGNRNQEEKRRDSSHWCTPSARNNKAIGC
jgi:hypothetical protein